MYFLCYNVFMEKKRIIIRNGTEAIYKNKTDEIPVVLCNVKNEHGIVFSAMDKRTNNLITQNGNPVRWSAMAIDLGIFIIKNPEYTEDFNENSIQFDELAEQKANLKKFFNENVKFNDKPFTLDDEQIAAVLSNQNTLITARAGSGKTRVLIAKLIYLFECQKLNENNVLAFCFNRNARLEIADRLNNRCLVNNTLKYQNYDVAKTFHSFSKSAINIGEQILKNRTQLIKMIINDFRKNEKEFAKDVYDFFRKDTLKIDRKHFYNTESYYKYVRNSEYTTLNGEKVKSKAEKYIADYLFEHGINYVYEKSFYPYKISFDGAKLTNEEIKRCKDLIGDRKETIPDFYLPKYNIIWEHWAVSGNENEEEISNFEKMVGNYDEYLQNKDWKQKFWSTYWRSKLLDNGKYNKDIKNVKGLIETVNCQFSSLKRDDVEHEIEKVLRNYGIYAKKLPEEFLVKLVWEKCIDGFTTLIEQFINKLEQNYFDDIDGFADKMESIEDEKTRIYYHLGFKVYKKYIDILSSKNNIGEYALYNDYEYDFNQIIYECSKMIKAGKLDEKIKEIKWLLIDEYQDFSRLFDYLISSIIERNNKIKVFCVGDDWQAINRFAGSDIKYFKNFLSNYENANLFNLTTNHRSENHIVQFANRFMDKCGIAGSRPKSPVISSGISKEIDISTEYIGKFDENNIYLNLFEENERNKVEKAQYIKVCRDIIKNNQNKRIMILSRSNTILGKDLEDFNVALRKICLEFMTLEDYNKNVILKTVHKSKGEEADTVILLNVNEGIFPVFNSNNDLFEIFGQTTIDAVEDEEKLYYVALTRAVHNLYILYDNKTKSPFIMS